jgi:hypothetical protein
MTSCIEKKLLFDNCVITYDKLYPHFEELTVKKIMGTMEALEIEYLLIGILILQGSIYRARRK